MISANYEGDKKNLKKQAKNPQTTTASKINKNPQQQ